MIHKKRIEDLTPRQQEKLAALLIELDAFPVSQRIVRCEEALGFDPAIEADRERMDVAMAGAWAYDRALLYLDRLRKLNEERVQLGLEIKKYKQHPEPTTEAEVNASALAKVMAPHLSGKQEIVINFFCVSVQHVRSLLKLVSKSVGYEIPQSDLDYFNSFHQLRHHFEHWYNRLPGGTNENGLMTKSITPYGYYVRGGLETDDQDRIIVIEPKKPIAIVHFVEVNGRGVEKIADIVRETHERVGTLAIERVRAYHIADPSEIPSAKSVRQDYLFSAGGYEPNR